MRGGEKESQCPVHPPAGQIELQSIAAIGACPAPISLSLFHYSSLFFIFLLFYDSFRFLFLIFRLLGEAEDAERCWGGGKCPRLAEMGGEGGEGGKDSPHRGDFQGFSPIPQLLCDLNRVRDAPRSISRWDSQGCRSILGHSNWRLHSGIL